MRGISGAARKCSLHSRRLLHVTRTRLAITNFTMPAMSPTMSEGGIAAWKKQEGEAFTTGDVLLEIETDKATIDVEAQDDGVMGKILLPDGTKNVPVGKIIALLAEEGDDISNLEAPKEEIIPQQSSSPPEPPTEAQSKPQSPVTSQPVTPQSHPSKPPSHSRPLFPSVHRLLLSHNIAKPEDIKGTGVRGMLTKGDVLTYLGKASGPTGTYKESPSPIQVHQTSAKPAEVKPLGGDEIRRLIVSTMLQASIKARNPTLVLAKEADFDSVIADYLPAKKQAESLSPAVPSQLTSPAKFDYLDGLV